MTAAGEPTAADLAVIERWWRVFVATGAAPDELALVQRRLIRAVHTGELPSGPVHVKTMAFPRAKDRLRYAFRALPAAHEAAMLAAAASAGLPCPEVVAVRTARRLGLPHRSMLVLRSLPLAADRSATAERRPDDEARLAARLLAVGIEHRDLHQENFVRCSGGQLAVLDMQSARLSNAAKHGDTGVRLAVSARLVRDRQGEGQEGALASLLAAGLLHDERELGIVRVRAEAERARYEQSRVLRCMTTSTEFERRIRFGGIEHRLRGELGAGRWWRGDGGLQKAWIGQRARQLATGEPPAFRAFFRKWWWLGGGAALYVPQPWSDERIETAVRKASAAIPDH